MKEFILVGAGGFLGSAMRYGAGIAAKDLANFPIGTLMVNLAGSLLIGVLTGWLLKHHPNSAYYLFLVTGFCGGFTTFSTFSLENMRFIKAEMYGQFLIYGVGSLIGGLLLCFVGYWLGNRYFG